MISLSQTQNNTKQSSDPEGTHLLQGYLSQVQPMLASELPQRPSCKQQEKNSRTKHWFPSLPFQQFQVLFNSLFKVLCIFPSRYLYAIGLPPIFRFRTNLRPTLSCNPKQLDSLKTSAKVKHNSQEREFHPLCCPFPRNLNQSADRECFFTPQLGMEQRSIQIHKVISSRFSRPY